MGTFTGIYKDVQDMLNLNAQLKYLQFVLWMLVFMAGTESAVLRPAIR